MNKIFNYCIFVVVMIYLQSVVGQEANSKEPRISEKVFQRRRAGFVVSLRWKNRDVPFGTGHFCSASLITSQIVLSAASCFLKMNEQTNKLEAKDWRNMKVVLGSSLQYQLKYYTTYSNVKAVVTHEGYSGFSSRDDIAIAVMYDLFADFVIVHAAINLDPVPIGAACQARGWQHTSKEWTPNADTFYNGSFERVEDKQCGSYDMSRQMCLRNNQSVTKICPYDVGGPVVYREMIVGIVTGDVRTFTNADDTSNCLALYPQISSYRDWLKAAIKRFYRSGGYHLLGTHIYVYFLFSTVFKMAF